MRIRGRAATNFFCDQIKEEFEFHNLKMYPYDNDELDEEERALNAQIKVSNPISGLKFYLFGFRFEER